MDSAISVFQAFSPARNTQHGHILSSTRHFCCPKNVRKSLDSMRIHSERREGISINIDRRRLLLTSSTLGLPAFMAGKSKAEPFPVPDLNNCSYPTDLPDGATLDSGGTCCPPVSSGTSAVDFVFPSSLPMRTRQAAHLVDAKYIAKYDAALTAMKGLDEDDPRRFSQQARVHCAWCNGAYLVGSDSMDYQVHKSWLFAPFHRWYLYFYERILGHLIGDDTFALPYWNWDAEVGMSIPPMFIDTSVSMYDENRDACHQPPVILNITDPTSCDNGSVTSNYANIYTNMVSGATTASLFHGSAYRYGEGTAQGNISGTLESSPHNLVHAWVGSSSNTNRENMGSLYSAGRDPLFYSHHVNVDRMWSIWNDKLGRSNFTDTDLTDSKFVFFDENKQLVQVNAGDCYDTTKLRYEYQEVDIPWLSKGRSLKKAGKLRSKPSQTGFAEADEQLKSLTAPVTVIVKRPTKARTKKERAEQEEILNVEGIEVDMAETAKFSIFINYPEVNSTTSYDSPHYAGSFVHFSHGMEDMKSTSNKLGCKVGISETLEDVDADGDESVLVTLVPQATKFQPTTPIKFTTISIEFETK